MRDRRGDLRMRKERSNGRVRGMKNAVLRLAFLGLLAGFLILQQGTGRAQGPESAHLGDTQPAWSPTGELIAFVSTREVKPEIYVMQPDGEAQRQLTTSPLGMGSGAPAWSPDGRRIAFVTGSLGGSQISVMNADGSDQRLLASGRFNSLPEWSPEGRRIAFISNRTGSDGVYVIAAEGGDPVVLTAELPVLLGFSWSPDGTRLIFAAEKFEVESNLGPFPTFRRESVIDVAYASGRNRTTLVRDTVWNSGPVWSPDGRRIAFDCAGAICAMNPDGSNRVQLTSQRGYSGPVWSPDGRHIAFVLYHERKWQILVMNADGRGQFQLSGPGEGNWPTWSPDGRRIIYAARRGGLWQLYSVNADGTGETQLTQGR